MGLYDLSAQIRKILTAATVFVLFLAALWVAWIGLKGLYRLVFESKNAHPVAYYGKLSAPPLPLAKAGLTNTSFNFALPEGTFPATPKTMPVYPVPIPTGTLSSLDEANKKAHSLGFDSVPKRISDISYSWKDSNFKAKSFQMNIVTGSFLYKFDPLKDHRILKGIFQFDTSGDAVQEGIRFLKKSGSYLDDLQSGPTSLNFYKLSLKTKKRSRVTSFSEASLVEILFYRQSISNKYPFVQVNPSSSLIRVVLGTNLGIEDGVVEAEFNYWPINYNESSPYPIKDGASAWQDFQQGKASFVKGARKSYSQIFLGDMYLGYYETRNYQAFLQPVYVFTGSGKYKNNLYPFIAYLPAVSSDYSR